MNLPVKKGDFASQLQDEITKLGGEGFDPLLKFDGNKSKYAIGDNEIPLGHEYIAHVPQYARGWTKFVDKTPVGMRILKVADGHPPERDELDDLDRAGRDDDPWVFQRYLPLEDSKTGDLVVFVSKSVGGKIALVHLLKRYALNSDRGLPVVKLAVDTFPTKDYGKHPRPDFPIIRWERRALPPDVPGISGPTKSAVVPEQWDPDPESDMDDEIPF